MTMSTPPETARVPRINYAAVAPQALAAMYGLQQAVNNSGLEHSLLELVKMRVSQLNGCAFCIDMHFRDAKKAGEKDERLYLLDAWREAPIYTAREQAALQWAEALTRLGEHGVPDEIFAEVRKHFTEAELVNLSLAIVAINGWNRLSIGFKVPPRLQ
jgi:AhpD family alkylhydroperoxidase